MHCFVSFLVILTLVATSVYSCLPCGYSSETIGLWEDYKLAWCCRILNAVPDTDTLPADIQVLDIRSSSITSLKDNQFISFKKLQAIYVADSKVNNIQRHTFRYMKNVSEIGLHKNSLTKLPTGVFNDTPNLVLLWLNNNKLTELQKNLFSNLKYLKVISLKNNEITIIELNCFVNLPMLEKLILNNNKLKKLYLNPTILNNLQQLNLHDNPWNCDASLCEVLNATVRRKMWSTYPIPICINSKNISDKPWTEVRQEMQSIIRVNTPGVRSQNLELHCEHCMEGKTEWSVNGWMLQTTETADRVSTLQVRRGGVYSCRRQGCVHCKAATVTVPCNRCSCLDNFTVAECVAPLQITRVPDTLPQHIIILRVTDQKLNILDENQFDYFNQLQELHLERNNINVIQPNTFKNLKNLTLLTLTDNNIMHLHKDTFSFTPKLTKLLLDKNNLTILHKSLFSNLSSLQELDISHNKIHLIEDNCFIDVSFLHTINLSFNNLKRLQLSIINNLNSLKNLYLNDNPWQCDESLCEVMNAAVSGRISTGDNDPTCAAPHKLKDKRWHQIYEDFQPRIISNVSSVQEGQDITLQCQYCFVTNVMWTFNGIKLPRNMQQISDTTLMSTLKVKNARKEEQGYYVCHIDDCRRCKDAQLYVKVNGKHQQDKVNTKEVFHIIGNSSSNNTRRGVILLSYIILEDEGVEGKSGNNNSTK